MVGQAATDLSDTGPEDLGDSGVRLPHTEEGMDFDLQDIGLKILEFDPAHPQRAAQDREPLREPAADDRVFGLGRGAAHLPRQHAARDTERIGLSAMPFGECNPLATTLTW